MGTNFDDSIATHGSRDQKLKITDPRDETDAYRIFMGMQNVYHNIESNGNNAVAMAQQHAADATGAPSNLTMAQFAEVAAAHMTLLRYVETIAISNAADEE
jgi:hypothetical protein